MKLINKLLPVALAVAGMGAAYAAVSADEAKQLGASLTPWGAEAGANKDGTIPAYTGGLTKPPASYDPKKPGIRPDPFAGEKPLMRIDAKNADQYKDRLTPGTLAMIKKYPNTFFLDVHKTYRTAAYPKEWLDNSVKNATRCNLIADGDGVDTSNGCGGGAMFPIPKTGLEVLWNKQSSYRSTGIMKKDTVIKYVKPSGEVVETAHAVTAFMYPMGDPSYKGELQFAQRTEYKGPARLTGTTSLFFDKASNSERTAYSYSPASRRVRLAPDFAADTPISAMGGAATYDDDSLFQGKRDRYNWKLVGKKEVYLPYNNYRMSYPDPKGNCKQEDYLTANHPKADCFRWELHRVWHVQATLKDGKRHIYTKRDLFIDEDTLTAGLAENYDQSGQLYRWQTNAAIPMYDVSVPGFAEQVIVDLVSGIYVVNTNKSGIEVMKWVPEALNSEGTRNHMYR